MATLTPTKDTGATTKLSAVVYTEPEQQVTDELLIEQVAVDGVNVPFVADLLSAYLTHERCGVHLYRSVAGRTNNPVLADAYEEFGRETERHVEILEGVITSMGGNPSYVSPSARAVEGADSNLLQSTFLLGGSIDPLVQEMVLLDAVLLAESMDRANWDALAQLAQQLPEGELRTAFEDAVAEVQADEDKHLDWATATRAELVLLQAEPEAAVDPGATPEELVEIVSTWLA